MPRGRPRKVETQDALHAIMLAFWQSGYSGTSMADLAAASGMAKPGLYAAFGDKEALFEKALNHYFETIGGPIFEKLGKAENHCVEDLREFLTAIADLTVDENTPSGCFLVNAQVDCAYGPERHQQVVLGLRESRFNAIRDRLTKALADGELQAGTDLDRAATFLDGQFAAIAILGRSGSSKSELELFIESGLRSLPIARQDHSFEGIAASGPSARQ